jgi:mono/diheme cytochrome c family protein
VQATAMPAFKDQLGEEDRWNVLNYIRLSFGPGRAPPTKSP